MWWLVGIYAGFRAWQAHQAGVPYTDAFLNPFTPIEQLRHARRLAEDRARAPQVARRPPRQVGAAPTAPIADKTQAPPIVPIDPMMDE
jgi:hypothetical protein